MSSDNSDSSKEAEELKGEIEADQPMTITKNLGLVDKLYEKQQEKFEKMMFYLECEMNLLVYGVGSKRRILEKFLYDHPHEEHNSVVVRGYHSGLMPKCILTEIAEYIRKETNKKVQMKGSSRKWSSIGELVEYIKRQMLVFSEDDTKPIYVLIHSMDVGVLKGQEWQEMLGELTSCKYLRFIISVDNSKSATLFTDLLLDQYNFVGV